MAEDEQAAAPITLLCKHGKDTHSISIPAQATIQDVKEKLQQLTNVLPRGQKLIFKGRVLDANVRLNDAALLNNSKLMMIGTPGVYQGALAPAKQNLIANSGSTPNKVTGIVFSDGSRSGFKISDGRSLFNDAWKTTGIISLRDRRQEIVPNRVWAIGPAARVLDLAGNCLKRFPADVRQLINLQKLRLSDNGLRDEQIDWHGLVMLKQLTTLALDHNLLTCVPAEVAELCELKVFSAAYNKMVQVAEEFGFLSKLEKLNLSHNCLKELPSSFGQCRQLVEADFSANFLRDIPSSLGCLAKLKVLNLNYNALKTFPCEVLKGCQDLITLGLHGNELTVEYLRELEGWKEFDERRKAKHSKQLEFSVLDTSGGFDEGADSQHWHHF